MDNNEMASMLGGMFALGILGFVFVVAIAISVVVCMMLSDALKRVPAPMRRQEPGMVWLLMIPCFSAVWAFFVHPRVSQSMRNYFNSVGRYDVGDCGESLGLTYCILSVCGFIPYLGVLASLGALVVLIMFLVKINGLKAQIPLDAANQIMQAQQQQPQPYHPGYPTA